MSSVQENETEIIMLADAVLLNSFLGPAILCISYTVSHTPGIHHQGDYIYSKTNGLMSV